MKQPSREIIENARYSAKQKHYVCSEVYCDNCAVDFSGEPTHCECNYKYNSQFFKDFLAKYDTEESMDTEREIEALKARIAKLEGKKDTYPCIKRVKNDTIVLFTAPGNGTVLFDTGVYDIGYQSDEWTEDDFTETLTEYTVKV